MAPKRYSVYASPALDRALAERASHGESEGENDRSRSSTITAMVDRYAEIVRRSLPRLALNEWLLVFDSLNGVWLQESPAMSAAGLPHGVADSIQLDRLADKWAVDGSRLVEKLVALEFQERIAVIDAAERFWLTDLQPDQTGDQWRAPIRAIVGTLEDDTPKESQS